jgi:DNA-binding GntR family transcriptional regulator
LTTQLQKVRSQESLTSQVVSSLRAAIISGDMAAGEKHSVGSIAVQLGVSRTPVREAVLQLAKLGLVDILKNQGFVVIERDDSEVVRIFQIRRWLEVPAAGIAASSADDAAKARIRSMYERMLEAAHAADHAALERYDAKFHSAVLDAVGNPRLTQIVDDLRDLLITRQHTTTERSRGMIDIAHDHDGILAAIEDGDAARAEREMATHLDLTRDGVIAIL